MNTDNNSEYNGTEEQEVVEEFKKLGENYKSQTIYQKNLEMYDKISYDDLVEQYKNMRSELYNEKKAHKDLAELNIKLKSDLYLEENKTSKIKNENNQLKKLVKTYKSRKIIKFADKLVGILRFKKTPVRTGNLQSGNITKDQTPKETALQPVEKDLTLKQPKKIKDLKVAVILDEFSYNSFKYEFKALEIEPDNWLEIFQTEKPDLFFCESAWSGVDSVKRPWKQKISFYGNYKNDNRKVLLNILKYCEENNIPTIFWNKEDPTNFKSFYDTALKFDHLFTSEERCVPKYRDEHGHKSVHSLMFAAQPRLFNPVDTGERSEDVIFAGSWYSHFTQRCDEMSNIFDNILESGLNLKIYDRAYYTLKEDPKRIFPDKYGPYINPPVPHDEIFRVYKESKYALNINTVTDSDTMFARRAFELMLCNTLVLSNYSKGLYKLFKDNVVFVDKNEIDLSNTEEKRIQNLYDVLKNHTYTNRFKQILDTINFQYIPEEDTVTVYYTVKDEKDIENSLKHYETLNYPSKEVAFFLDNETPTPLMNKYKQYTVHPLNYVTNQLGTIKNNTPYYIFATQKLEPDFIEKAVLHYTYIQKKFGIKKGNKFTFQKTENTKNTLFTNENFTKTLNNTYNNKTNKFSVYDIEI